MHKSFSLVLAAVLLSNKSPPLQPKHPHLTNPHLTNPLGVTALPNSGKGGSNTATVPPTWSTISDPAPIWSTISAPTPPPPGAPSPSPPTSRAPSSTPPPPLFRLGLTSMGHVSRTPCSSCSICSYDAVWC
ncbi:hypothetical protein DFP72DRAFT_1066363 [Ephemerocybe angulata]|uniref:Uncharacterized protein n=1 Tax=Ephemerocybe angulata TaxID=980116 RepID=A0A8H6M6U6_9AGAR|nr:hypothetical protein DFP72DRAFT_1066363 [Tulosesus angulatus]